MEQVHLFMRVEFWAVLLRDHQTFPCRDPFHIVFAELRGKRKSGSSSNLSHVWTNYCAVPWLWTKQLVYEASFSQSARYHMHSCIHVCICWRLPEPTVTGNNYCYQSCTCQLFLTQMSEIFVTILPEFLTTSKHCRRFQKMFRWFPKVAECCSAKLEISPWSC